MRADVEREYIEYTRDALGRLQRFGYVLCGDPHTAADLVQDTLVALYVQWPHVRVMEHVDAYARKMLLRSFLTERRRPWRRMRLTGTVPDEVTSSAPALDERSALVSALRQVPPRQRVVLVLRFLYDLPVEEVAAVLECTPGTVKSQTSRGLVTLRRLLAEPAEPAATGSGRGGSNGR